MIGTPVDIIMRQADAAPVNNSTVLVSDDTLLVPASGNAKDVLFVECFLIVSGPDTTSDFKLAWSIPAGVTGYHGPISAGSNIGGWNAVNAATTPGALATALTGTFTYGTLAGLSGIYHGALFFVGGTAGTITLQWAQGTAFVGNTLLKLGSFLRVTKIQ